MRLVSPIGPNKVEGRVEYCINGVWGTVSGYGFDVRDAHVVCRRLGHQTPRALIFGYAYFGQGFGPVVFRNLGCTGNEYRLEDCTYSASYYASHTRDVGVKCSERVLTDCINGSVRLVNGTTPDEGRLEVCINGEWGTVCSHYWDRSETKVICRQLGYGQDAEGSRFRYSKYGDGNYQQILWNIQCTGSETNLTSCNNYHNSNCYYGRTVGIKCYNTTICTHGEIKLYGGQSDAEGDLQFCYNGAWVFLCDFFFGSWIPPNVVCRQLGYQNNNYTTVTEYLRDLNWYYNGNKILNSSKYLINNGNKTLVINNITDGDIGEYSVRFDGLRFFIQDYNAQLSCSVSGGYPFYHNITLIKNGVAIANSTESELVYNTSGSSKYGLYQCTVDTTAQYIKKELLLEEE
uniref:SRCR domain-containing protein n=1 Tax=Amphimedon queenslandica TaxID=400682 RepID=A0A1X7T5H5_AMPQE